MITVLIRVPLNPVGGAKSNVSSASPRVPTHGRSVGVSDRSFEELVGRSVGIFRVGLLFQNEGRSVGKPESGVLRGHGSVGRTGKKIRRAVSRSVGREKISSHLKSTFK